MPPSFSTLGSSPQSSPAKARGKEEEFYGEKQLNVFGKLNRNRMVKELNLARKISLKSYKRKRRVLLDNLEEGEKKFYRNNNKKFKDHVVLEKLEDLLREANKELALNLTKKFSKDCEKLLQKVKKREHEGEFFYLKRIKEIKEDVIELNNNKRDKNDKTLKEFKNDLEKRVLLFNSNKRIQAIIEYSIEFFAKLLNESALFNSLIDDDLDFDYNAGLANNKRAAESFDERTRGSINMGQSRNNDKMFLLEAQELKLFACVECQHLRSALRFKWLTGCLLLAFSSNSNSKPISNSDSNSTSASATPMSLELKRLLLLVDFGLVKSNNLGRPECGGKNYICEKSRATTTSTTSHSQQGQGQRPQLRRRLRQKASNDSNIRSIIRDRKLLEQQIRDKIRGANKTSSAAAGLVAGSILSQSQSNLNGCGGGCSQQQEEEEEKMKREEGGPNSLIRGPEEEGEQEVLLYKLAQLMSILLRQHFLQPALERLCNLLERHQYVFASKEEVRMSDGDGCLGKLTTKKQEAPSSYFAAPSSSPLASVVFESTLIQTLAPTSTPTSMAREAKTYRHQATADASLARGNELGGKEEDLRETFFPFNTNRNHVDESNNTFPIFETPYFSLPPPLPAENVNSTENANADGNANGNSNANKDVNELAHEKLSWARGEPGGRMMMMMEEEEGAGGVSKEPPACGGKRVEAIKLPRKKFSKIEMKVELCENENENDRHDDEDETKITTSKPDEDLKRIFAFIIDELAGLCRNLPRLESQLESMRKVSLEEEGAPEEGLLKGSGANEDEDVGIKVDKKSKDMFINGNESFLPVDVGELLLEAKKRINLLIDSSCSLLNFEKDLSFYKSATFVNKNHWIQQDYLVAVDLLERLRRGRALNDFEDYLTLLSNVNMEDIEKISRMSIFIKTKQLKKDDDADDERLSQLELTCKQIDLLNLFELKLENGSMKRYHDMGFVLLDYGPLRDSLIKCFKKERLLLIRIELDSLLKLMQRLRLQFDEIELGIDLESAIEDYLANKWQAKQQQPAGSIQAVILSGADDDLVDEFDMLNSPQLASQQQLNQPLSSSSIDNAEMNLIPDSSTTTTTLPSRRRFSMMKTMFDNRELGIAEVESELSATMAGNNVQNSEFLPDEERETNLIEQGQLKTNEISAEEEEFVAALTNNSNNINNNRQQLLTPATTPTVINKSEEEQLENVTRGDLNLNIEDNNNELLDTFQQQQLDRRVGQLIECQLLFEKYEYFKELLTNELEPLEKDLRLIFDGGLIFLSEYVFCEPDLALDQPSIISIELTQELSQRSREFNFILKNSFENLNFALRRLMKLNQFRSLVLSRLLIEFHHLMSLLSLRQYYSSLNSCYDKSQNNSTIRQLTTNIGQLDSYQETAEWCKKLELRFEFIKRQNDLLTKEHLLLRKSKLEARGICLRRKDFSNNMITNKNNSNDTKLSEEQEGDGEFLKSIESREIILNCWSDLVELIASFWCLVEEYETQQVKWLNLDTKRMEFNLIKEIFESFKSRLNNLKTKLVYLIELEEEKFTLNNNNNNQDDNDNDYYLEEKKSIKLMFKLNLDELERRFEFFDKLRLPIFKFLTNKHLTSLHWQKLSTLLASREGGDNNFVNSRLMVLSPQNCTTLAQFLELLFIDSKDGQQNRNQNDFDSLDRIVIEQLELIDKQATLEHELTMFLLSEAGQSNGNCDYNYDYDYDHEGKLIRRTLEYSSEKSTRKPSDIDISEWLRNWSDEELILAGSRFLEIKLSNKNTNTNNNYYNVDSTKTSNELAKKLVSIHSLIKRFINLKYNSIGLEIYLNDDEKRKLNFVKFKSENEIENKGLLDGRKGATKWARKKALVLTTTKATNNNTTYITNSNLIKPSLFVEFLRIFTKSLLERQEQLMKKCSSIKVELDSIEGHLEEINNLIERVKELHETDLKDAEEETEKMLIYLERQRIKLELEREILATKEAMALERQREALRIRDDCIRQITERAIPAIRASTKALDCLNEKSLKTLRSIKPKPPEAVRLVIEAVCLLRASSKLTLNGGNLKRGHHYVVDYNEKEKKNTPIPNVDGADSREAGAGAKAGASEEEQEQEHESGQQYRTGSNVVVGLSKTFEPERRFDSLRGIIIEDYWPVASKQLAGTHSFKFINDLRQLDKKSIPNELMQLIRARYLSSSKFKLKLIQRVSLDASHLARWLIAVDVFDRVINVVKPNYRNYLSSEKKLSELYQEVNRRHKEIDLISFELLQMEDSFEIKIKRKMSLVEALEECKLKLKTIQSTRVELFDKRKDFQLKLKRLLLKQKQLANKCLLEAAKSVYMDSMKIEDQIPIIGLIEETIL